MLEKKKLLFIFVLNRKELFSFKSKDKNKYVYGYGVKCPNSGQNGPHSIQLS
jgi:hypothetical protein